MCPGLHIYKKDKSIIQHRQQEEDLKQKREGINNEGCTFRERLKHNNMYNNNIKSETKKKESERASGRDVVTDNFLRWFVGGGEGLSQQEKNAEIKIIFALTFELFFSAKKKGTFPHH